MTALPRFLCDEMLGHLCRYLRAAGYDTLLANGGERDAELLRQCREEGRHFLTQDALIAEHKAADSVALILPHAPLDELASRVGAHYRLDWLAFAFTRCLVDNTPLLLADEAAIARIPPNALQHGMALHNCPTCGRVYWRGSHFRRMQARLKTWQRESI
jgi:uncharacterized protein with PIN domain